MKFYRCELRDCISETDMHYAQTFDEALEYCRKDFANENFTTLHATYWIWQSPRLFGLCDRCVLVF